MGNSGKKKIKPFWFEGYGAYLTKKINTDVELANLRDREKEVTAILTGLQAGISDKENVRHHEIAKILGVHKWWSDEKGTSVCEVEHIMRDGERKFAVTVKYITGEETDSGEYRIHAHYMTSPELFMEEWPVPVEEKEYERIWGDIERNWKEKYIDGLPDMLDK